MANQGTIKLGPWAGTGGRAWDFNPGSDTAIKVIMINSGGLVESITFESINRATGQTTTSETFGSTGGGRTWITIDGPEEYLTSIKGTMTEYLGQTIIQSLVFHTNKKTHGPFGHTDGTPFEIPMRKGEIVGFFGRCGKFVDAIGIYVKPAN